MNGNEWIFEEINVETTGDDIIAHVSPLWMNFQRREYFITEIRDE